MGRMPHAKPGVNAIFEMPEASNNVNAVTNATTNSYTSNVPITQVDTLSNANTSQQQAPYAPVEVGNNNDNNEASDCNQIEFQPAQQFQQSQCYAGAMMQPVEQMITTNYDMNFQQQPQCYVQPQAYDTNAHVGLLSHAGINLCPAHKRHGGRCRLCEGGGCEWQQLYDPIGIANPNIKPLRAYGEMLTEKYGLPQRDYNDSQAYPNDSSYRPANNSNYRPAMQGPQPRQTQYAPAQCNVPYQSHPQVNQNAQYSNATYTTGSGNAQGAPSQPTGCQ